MIQIPTPLPLLGVPLTPFASYRQVEECVAHLVESRAKAFCVAINPEKIHRARVDPELSAQLQQADIHICDGIGADFVPDLSMAQVFFSS